MAFLQRMHADGRRQSRSCSASRHLPEPIRDKPRAASVADAWRQQTVLRGVLVRFRWGGWTLRSCPHTYPRPGPDQSRAPSLPQRFGSPRSAVLRAPRTPFRHADTSPSAYSQRLRPTWAAGSGLSCSPPDLRCVPSPLPRERPAQHRIPRAVCCLRREMIGPATPPFGSLSHEAAKFTLPHWARSFAPALGVIRPRDGFRRSARTPDLAGRLEPATRRTGVLTAAGLAPAGLIQQSAP